MKLHKKLKKNIEVLNDKLSISDNFDIITREVIIADKKACILFVDGFTKDMISLKILEKLMNDISRKEVVPNTIEKLITEKIGYTEVESTDSFDDLIYFILSGNFIVLIEGESEAIVIDTREYPSRQPEESDLEKVTRGSRDGLVETLVSNTALIRRRIRDPNLRNEIYQVGERSKTDVVISYISDVANPDLVKEIKEKVTNISTDALTMGEKTLEEFILNKNLVPLPKVRFTERPDVVAAHLLEGHIAVMVDTTPSVMILPATFFHFTQHIEDYYQNPIIGTYIRWIRLLSIFLSLILTPTWLVIVLNKAYLPDWLEFIGPKDPGTVPIFLQFIILEFGIDLIKTVLIHIPSTFGTSLGLLGAIMLGELAVEVGLFDPEAILYIAIVAIATFASPSIEFSLSMRLFRLLILILTGFLSIWGYVSGILIVLIILTTTKSVGGIHYLWPLIPFDYNALKVILFRKPIPEVKNRPKNLKTLDSEVPKK